MRTVGELPGGHFPFPNHRKLFFIRKFCIGILRARNNFGFFIPSIIINVFNCNPVNNKTYFYGGGPVFNDFKENDIAGFSVDYGSGKGQLRPYKRRQIL